eukprot:4646131-Alexandrium_andersonii.AAC.1
MPFLLGARGLTRGNIGQPIPSPSPLLDVPHKDIGEVQVGFDLGQNQRPGPLGPELIRQDGHQVAVGAEGKEPAISFDVRLAVMHFPAYLIYGPVPLSAPHRRTDGAHHGHGVGAHMQGARNQHGNVEG